METETYSATSNSRKEKEEELSYLKDPFSSFGSLRNSYIFALIFYAPFFYIITNAFIDFWPAPLIKKNVFVPVKKFSFKVHFKDYLGQEHSQQIDYDSITYPDLEVWRFSQGKHPTLKSFDVFVTLCYFKTGYKPLKLRSLNGQPLIYFDNDPIMDDYMTSQFPDFEENFKVEIEDETQMLDLAAYNAMSGQIDLIIGKSSYIQPLNLCSVPPLTSSYPNSQEIVVKHFFINKDVTEDSVGSSKIFNKSIVTSSNDLVEYVRHLLLIGTILNQHHLIMNFDRVSLHTVGGYLKVFTDSSFSCLKSQSETNEYNTRCIRKLISTSFCEKQVLNNIFFPGQPMALFKDGLLSFLKHTKLGPSILGNDLIDIDLLNNYFENPSGLGILEILDVPEHFIKLLARMFVVNIRVPSEIRQNVTVPTEFSIFTKADDVEAAIKGYLGTTYEFLHLFLIGALSPITKIAEESLSKLSSLPIPLPPGVTIDEIKTKIEECKNNYSFPLVNVSKYFCDQIQKQPYSKSESNLIKMAVSLINIDEDTKLIS